MNSCNEPYNLRTAMNAKHLGIKLLLHLLQLRQVSKTSTQLQLLQGAPRIFVTPYFYLLNYQRLSVPILTSLLLKIVIQILYKV